MAKEITEVEAWELLKPVCREIVELVNERMITFQSGSENNDGSFHIYLSSKRIHLASRGFKDSIGDVEYGDGKLRIGLRSNNRPGLVYLSLQ